MEGRHEAIQVGSNETIICSAFHLLRTKLQVALLEKVTSKASRPGAGRRQKPQVLLHSKIEPDRQFEVLLHAYRSEGI